MIKDAKTSDWRAFVGREYEEKPWSKVVKIYMGLGNKDSLSGLKTRNGWTKSWNESANVLMNEFFPPEDGIPIPEDNANACVDVSDFAYEE